MISFISIWGISMMVMVFLIIVHYVEVDIDFVDDIEDTIYEASEYNGMRLLLWIGVVIMAPVIFLFFMIKWCIAKG